MGGLCECWCGCEQILYDDEIEFGVCDLCEGDFHTDGYDDEDFWLEYILECE
jgi:hypothetical protein